jgi:peptidoglycan hydrolase CwlO-like protein
MQGMRPPSKRLVIPLILCAANALSSCGVETVATAGTSAVAKQKEIEAARKTVQEAEKQIGAASGQVDESAKKAGEVDK